MPNTAASALVEALLHLVTEYPTDTDDAPAAVVTLTDPITGQHHEVGLLPGHVTWLTTLLQAEEATCQQAHSDQPGACGHCRGTGSAHSRPECPECNERMNWQADGPDLLDGLWACPACGRRSAPYGGWDEDLPSYMEDGIIYFGTGIPDEEATAEMESQDQGDDEDGEENGWAEAAHPPAPSPRPGVEQIRAALLAAGISPHLQLPTAPDGPQGGSADAAN